MKEGARAWFTHTRFTTKIRYESIIGLNMSGTTPNFHCQKCRANKGNLLPASANIRDP